MSYYLVFLLCLSALCLKSNAQENTVCKTPTGEQGACISIKLCAPLLELLVQVRSNPSLKSVLQESQCGVSRSRDPLVCCPNAQATAETEKPQNIEEVRCGTTKQDVSFPKIVGGFDASEGQFPWNIAIGYMEKGKINFRCGGSIISVRHILTAAHCISPEVHVVRYGVLNLYDDPPHDVLVEKTTVHEKYARLPQIVNDIGMIKVVEDIVFSDKPFVRPICLPDTPVLRSNLFENKLPFIAGWGSLWYRGPSSNRLQGLQIRVVPNDDCQSIFRQHEQALIDEHIICAGQKRGGQDSCQGDSGGPMVSPVNGRLVQFYQIGIISYGYGCAEPGYVGVYTRVTAYMDWINSNLN